jgi:hypothetical protein
MPASRQCPLSLTIPLGAAHAEHVLKLAARALGALHQRPQHGQVDLTVLVGVCRRQVGTVEGMRNLAGTATFSLVVGEQGRASAGKDCADHLRGAWARARAGARAGARPLVHHRRRLPAMPLLGCCFQQAHDFAALSLEESRRTCGHENA